MEKYFSQPNKQASQERFATVPTAEIPRSKFDRSHGRKTTCSHGKLVPVYLDEVLPGDTFTMNSTIFCRLATPLKPIMDNLYVDIHFFFTPNRLVWNNWQKFMGEREPGDEGTEYTIPTTEAMDLTNKLDQTLALYFGLPRASGVTVNALPFRNYMLIFNEWYRDENLTPSFVFDKGDGVGDVWADQGLIQRMQRKGYFTGALPWPQKGSPVSIPILDTAPVVSDGGFFKLATNADGTGLRNVQFGPDTGAGTNYKYDGTAQTGQNSYFGEGLQADLSAATSVTINALRTAFQVQRLYERNARGGTRYIEIVLSHFGVQSPDLRAIRPVYLGGGTTRFNFSPIPATANVTGTTIQGDLAAYATALNNGGFTHSFTEHGYVMGILSTRAEQTYQQGIERMWSKNTRYDFYWPVFAHLGEQAIFNREIYHQGTSADLEIFGYQERYAEYRYKPSTVTGKFNSTDPESLDFWHLAYDYSALPTLSTGFIWETAPVKRCLAVPSEPDYLVDCWFNLQCERPMPVYSVPGMIDHF